LAERAKHWQGHVMPQAPPAADPGFVEVDPSEDSADNLYGEWDPPDEGEEDPESP